MKVTYFRMGHAEMNEGWSFGEGSWGVRVDGVIIGVFPTEVEAYSIAHSEAAGDEDASVEKLS